MRFRQSVVEKFWLSVTFINFLIIKLFKSVCYFMHVCIFGRFTFKILGQSTFTLIQCLFLHLEILLFITSLFISITIIFTIITLLLLSFLCILYTNFHYCNYFVIFSLVATYALTLYWFQTWFTFCHCFLPKHYINIFLIFQALLCTIFLLP